MSTHGDMQSQIRAISEQLVKSGAVAPSEEQDAADQGRREAPAPVEGKPPLADDGQQLAPQGQESSELEEDGKPVGEEPAAEEIRNLSELAAALEVEPEFLYGLSMNLSEKGPDGKPVSLTLGEIKDRLQEYERGRGELDTQREALMQERNAFMQQAQAVLMGGQRMQQDLIDARARIQAVIQQRDAVNWDEFERLDPGRAALERQRFERMLNDASGHFQQTAHRLETQQAQFAQQYRAAQDQELLKRIPEWRNRETALKDANAIGEWASKTYGYTPNDLYPVVDWQHRDILRKAYLYDQIQAGAQATQQQVRNAPRRLLKSGVAPTGAQLSQQKVDTLVTRAQQSRSRDDQVAAARAVLDQAFARQRR